MAPVQQTRTLYLFSELGPEAQARAIENYRTKNAGWLGTDWAGEWRESRSAIQDLFESAGFSLDFDRDGRLRGVEGPEVGECYFACHEPLQGVRLWKYLVQHVAPSIQWGPHNSAEIKKLRANYYPEDQDGDDQPCPFTGYCGDESYLDPLRAFLGRPTLFTTAEELVKDCFHAGDKAWEVDRDYQYSDDGIRDSIEANDDETGWLEDGSEK